MTQIGVPIQFDAYLQVSNHKMSVLTHHDGVVDHNGVGNHVGLEHHEVFGDHDVVGHHIGIWY